MSLLKVPRVSIYFQQNKTEEKYIYTSLPNSKYIKNILKCPLLNQLYTIRHKYTNVQNIYTHTYIDVHTYIHVHTYRQTDRQTDRHTYIHTHIMIL